jgi:hypothetical protein
MHREQARERPVGIHGRLSMKSASVLSFFSSARVALLAVGLLGFGPAARAGVVIFDFDGGPLNATTPLTQTSDGINAFFTASATGYSIQEANVIGFRPAGFSGFCLFPNSTSASDLLISFDKPLIGVSLLYAPDEIATDTSCTMRITGFNGANSIGTNTFSISPAGTWPTGTIALTSLVPFNKVVIHYDSPPPTGGNFNPVFMVDDLAVTTANAPEPGSMALLALGLGTLAGAGRFPRQRCRG